MHPRHCERSEAIHLSTCRAVDCFAALAMTAEIAAAHSARHMHAGLLARIPLAVDRALDLRRQLQQQPVIGLLGDRLDAERQAVLVGGERQRDRGDAAEIGERRKGKIAPEIAEPVQHVEDCR